MGFRAILSVISWMALSGTTFGEEFTSPLLVDESGLKAVVFTCATDTKEAICSRAKVELQKLGSTNSACKIGLRTILQRMNRIGPTTWAVDLPVRVDTLIGGSGKTWEFTEAEKPCDPTDKNCTRAKPKRFTERYFEKQAVKCETIEFMPY